MGHPYDDMDPDWRTDHVTRRQRKIALEHGLAKARRQESLATFVTFSAATLVAIVVGVLIIKLAFVFAGH